MRVGQDECSYSVSYCQYIYKRGVLDRYRHFIIISLTHWLQSIQNHRVNWRELPFISRLSLIHLQCLFVLMQFMSSSLHVSIYVAPNSLWCSRDCALHVVSMGLLEEFGLPGMVRCVPVGLFITQRYYVHWVKTTPPRPATPISRFV